MRRVIVTDYNPKWSEQFKIEAEKIKEIFSNILIDIHHIGSTSVPGLAAKPIIDIMPLVDDITKVDRYNHKMAALGYEAMGEFGIPGRRFFRKGGDNRTHHVHVFEFGNKEVERHLAFRDYLRYHPEAAKEYGELKKALAHRFPTDMEAYIDGKDEYIKNLEKVAIKWYAELKEC